ncbi:prepilin peptidase [Nocardia sp. X0981]
MTAVCFPLFAAWCGVLSVIDIRTRRLPNPLTLPGAAAVFGYALFIGEFPAAARGAALLATPHLLLHLLRPAALGAGDVKLALGLGAAAGLGGAQAWVWSAVTAPLLTASAGIGLLLARRYSSGRRGTGPGIRPLSPDSPATTVPHGPSMCAATLLGLLLC